MSTPREITEEWERDRFSPRAALAAASKGRETSEPQDDLRTCFQRDRDRIIHSKAFRRLKHKTQVFLAPEGDHYRTRLTHTLEVMQVARTVARALRLNEDLTEAVALAHDLGHPPFGHAGEDALNEMMRPVGGFRHFEQSLRVVRVLEIRTRADGTPVRGLNLTWEVRDGIGSHSKGLADLRPAADDGSDEALPATLEGQVVRLADRIAYVHHDTDDAILLGAARGGWLGRMVRDLVSSSGDQPTIRPSEDVRTALNALVDFLTERVYRGPSAALEVAKARRLVQALYDYYLTHPDEISLEYRELIARGEPAGRVVGDFLAGMTDRYAIRLAEALFIPHAWAP
ncbi:MAG: deoxyguanosinetriphosphate triphosphohydrolase [Armatimonadetes bacterium 13_1_40CM_3_65_7]|nr:MAG: deoxyguanosinetriphosphate triphosphohydrolase [Armatimonadetes bacterium 13_1_40CM_3_65_7]